MLIVDFAPHDLEFLRDEHAHLRLGFPLEQVTNWLETAGLEVQKTEQLSSKHSHEEKSLVLTLWLAQNTHVGEANNLTNKVN